jgi:ribonuclease III
VEAATSAARARRLRHGARGGSPDMTSADWPREWVRGQLGYEAHDLALFRAALTHRSASGSNNERLEFLGDAVLNLVIAHQLYAAFPQASEGDLSRLRARLVSREPLAEVGAALGLGGVLQLGSGELKSGGFRRQSILADALEALCGAIFLDGGLGAVQPVIARLFAARLATLPEPAALKDAKTRLQEYLQSRSLALPRYSVLSIEGEDHAQTFRVSCEVVPLRLRVEGAGSSRRRAEQEAAARMLERVAAQTPDGVP